MKLPSILFCLMLLLFASCEYQPTGSNYVEVDSKYSVPNAYFELPMDADTVYFAASKAADIHYKLAGELNRFLKVGFFIDSTVLYTSASSSGYFEVKVDTSKAITHFYLTMKALFRSGTKSLADRAGAEGSVLTKNWHVIIYNFNKYKAPKLRFENVGGRLKVSWDKYPFDDFSHYKLIKTIKYQYPYEINITTISNINTTEFFDDSYVGERAMYNITFDSKYPNFFSYTESEPTPEIGPPTVEYLDRETAMVQWKKCSYYTSFGYYYLDKEYEYQHTTKQINDINQLRETLDEMYFGGKYTISCYPKPKDTRFSGYYGKEMIYLHGEPSVQFDQINLTSGDIGYLARKLSYQDSLFQYNFKTKKILAGISLGLNAIEKRQTFSASPSGQYLAINNGKSIDIYKNGSLNSPQTFSDWQITGTSLVRDFYRIKIMDNGIAFICNNSKFWIYDFAKGKLIDSVEKFGQFIPTPSGDFHYFSIRDEYGYIYLYEINEQNDIVPLLPKIHGGAELFKSSNNSVFYYNDSDRKQYIEYDCTSKKEVKATSMNLYYSMIDEARALHYYYYGGWMEIYHCDGTTFTLVDKFRCTTDGQFGVYKDGYFYIRQGLRCKINY